MFAEKGLRLIAGLFIGAYVARYLGPAQYGLLNYSLSLVLLFSVIAYLGMDSIVIRELVRDESKRDKLLGTAFVLKLMAATSIFLVLIAFVEMTATDRVTRSLIYIIGAGIFFETFNVIDFFFQARVASKYVVWSQMAALAFVSVFRVVLIFNEAPLVWFAWATALDFFILAIGMIFFYRHNGYSIFAWKFDRKVARELLTASWPLIFSAMAVTVYLRIDQVMIKWMLGDVATGNYGVAVRLSELWNFIPVAICSSVFPAILNAREISSELYHTRLQRLYDLMVGLSLAIAIPMTFLSDWIVILLFGDAYTSAGEILMLYIWSSVFVFLGVANGKWIISENLQKFRMVTMMTACVINVVLNYVLIKFVGITGAAISTLVSYAFATYFSLLFSARTRPMFLYLSRSFNALRLIKLFRK